MMIHVLASWTVIGTDKKDQKISPMSFSVSDDSVAFVAAASMLGRSRIPSSTILPSRKKFAFTLTIGGRH